MVPCGLWEAVQEKAAVVVSVCSCEMERVADGVAEAELWVEVREGLWRDGVGVLEGLCHEAVAVVRE